MKMGQDRLSNLALLSIEKDRTQKLKTDRDVVEFFFRRLKRGLEDDLVIDRPPNSYVFVCLIPSICIKHRIIKIDGQIYKKTLIKQFQTITNFLAAVFIAI